MCFIRENLTLYFRSCTCVPSPQSIKNRWPFISKTCEVGWAKIVGVAEWHPRIIKFKVQDLKFKLEIETIKNKYPLKNFIVVANKIDKLPTEQISNLKSVILSSVEGSNLLALSAKTGKGVEELQQKLLEFVNTGALRNNETIVTNSRHYDSLLKALEEIIKVQQGIDSNLSGDLLAIDIRQALYYFGEITGEISNDELLGNIFANFCIGK